MRDSVAPSGSDVDRIMGSKIVECHDFNTVFPDSPVEREFCYFGELSQEVHELAYPKL